MPGGFGHEGRAGLGVLLPGEGLEGQILHGHFGGGLGQVVGVEGAADPLQEAHHLLGPEAVADAEPRQGVNLGEGVEHQQVGALIQVGGGVRVGGRVLVFRIGLVHHQDDVLPQLAHQALQLGALQADASGVVGVAEVDEARVVGHGAQDVVGVELRG